MTYLNYLGQGRDICQPMSQKKETLTEMSVMRIVIRYVPTTCNIKRYRNMHLPSIISCKVCYDIALFYI